MALTKLGKRAPALGHARLASLPVADIALASTAVSSVPGQPILADYTCDGADRSPALTWKGVPAGTAELALFVLSDAPVNGKLFFDWAVMGLSPTSGGISAGGVPPGAAVGRNSFGRNGYSICPAKGHTEGYVFALYALPKKISATQGFNPTTMRALVRAASHHVGVIGANYGRS